MSWGRILDEAKNLLKVTHKCLSLWHADGPMNQPPKNTRLLSLVLVNLVICTYIPCMDLFQGSKVPIQ